MGLADERWALGRHLGGLRSFGEVVGKRGVARGRVEGAASR